MQSDKIETENTSTEQECQKITSLLGSTLKGRFLIGEQIGQGSYGLIYKVQDMKQTQRKLAIKIGSDMN